VSVRDQGDYAFYVANARKLFWVPMLFGMCSAPFAPWTMPIHLVIVGYICWLPRELSRAVLTLGRLLVLIQGGVVGLLLSMTAAIVSIALHEEAITLTGEFLGLLAGAFVLFTALSYVIYRNVWEDKRQRFMEASIRGQLLTEAALRLLTGRDGLSFWRSGAGPSLMVTAAVASAWLGYRVGFDVQALIVLALLFASWILCVGTVIAQGLAIIRHPRFAAIPLYQA
jgi:hypothetical protein